MGAEGKDVQESFHTVMQGPFQPTLRINIELAPAATEGSLRLAVVAVLEGGKDSLAKWSPLLKLRLIL